jgi:hypothetical protein
MKSIATVKEEIEKDPDHWALYLMDFVDDFRHYKDLSALATPFSRMDDRWAALLASTAEQLCRELMIDPPSWLESVPACRDPWFVAGLENLKAIALAESPAPFRLRKIFVTERFLDRA